MAPRLGVATREVVELTWAAQQLSAEAEEVEAIADLVRSHRELPV